MKKLILFAISVLSIYLTYTMFKSGVNLDSRLKFLNLDVYSYEEMIKEGEVLDSKLDEMEKLNSEDMVAAKKDVELEKANYESKKSKYKSLEENASEEEIAKANQKQIYLLDYLWIVVGNYASDNNVKYKMETDDANLRINFDITGSYVSVINFIYDLENDENLNFNLNGIMLASSSSENTTKASFSVDGITVKTSSVSIN